MDRSSFGQGQVCVAFRESMQLGIPVAATNLATGQLALRRTKFTLAAIGELLALVKEWNLPCPGTPGTSGGGSRKP